MRPLLKLQVPNIRADKEVPFKNLIKITSDQYIRADKEVLFKTLIKLTLVLHVAVGNVACSVHV